MTEIHSAHDKFFKQNLADIQIAKDFFKIHLPKELLNRVNLNTLKICKETYIEDKFKETVSDIVYKVIIDAEYHVYFYLAIEHQSTFKNKDFFAFRLMKYQLSIISNHLKQHPKSKYLPIVFPMMFYHGKKKLSLEKTDFFNLFSNIDLAKRCFLQPFHLIDVSSISDEEIKTHKLVSLLEIVQKHIYDRDYLLLVDQLNEVILNILAISDESHALIYIKNTLYYIMNKANISDKIRFKKALEKISIVKDGEFMSTMAEEYINEGIKKGLQQGIPVGKKEGKLETIKAVVFKMLQSGMQYSDISKFTELSEEEIKNLDLDNF